MSQPSFDFGDDLADAPHDEAGNPTYTVGELADHLNAMFGREWGRDGVWVRGEIDGLRHSGPHTYFSLVEHGENGKAVLNVSLFAPTKRRLTPLLKRNRLQLGNGMKVRINGHPDFYAPAGRLGLKMAGIDPRFTLGELSQARDQIVRRLVASGLYEANRQRPVAAVPLRVGVVTSVGTAAWHDFSNELEASGFGFRLAVCDTRVQGDTAVESVAAAIRTLGRRPDLDVVVVVRGGGARNELAVFDAEPIAVAIATSRLPVITGLGHEVDRAVADDVAHTSVKTPTAAARHLIDAVSHYRADVETCWLGIARAADQQLEHAQRGVVERAGRARHHTHAAVERASERLSMRAERLVAQPHRQLDREADHLVRHADRLTVRPVAILDTAARDVELLANRVDLADPVNLLRRGWSITRDADGNIVRSADSVRPDTLLTTRLADGSVTSRVTDPAESTDDD